jgi:hypothetical protein
MKDPWAVIFTVVPIAVCVVCILDRLGAFK